MHILGIDTATKHGGVALSWDQELIGLIMMKTPFQYSQTILDLVDFMLNQHKLKLREIDYLAVVTGPGSFTGLRVGLATVKGFAQVLDKPIIGISTLKTLAYCFRHDNSCLVPMIDAGRDQIYGAVFRVTDSGLEIEGDEQVLPPSQWLEMLPSDNCTFIGDGSARYRDLILATKQNSEILETERPIIGELCGLARLDIEAGNTVSAQELKANYIRPTDAELNRTGGRRPEATNRNISTLDPTP